MVFGIDEQHIRSPAISVRWKCHTAIHLYFYANARLHSAIWWVFGMHATNMGTFRESIGNGSGVMENPRKSPYEAEMHHSWEMVGLSHLSCRSITEGKMATTTTRRKHHADGPVMHQWIAQQKLNTRVAGPARIAANSKHAAAGQTKPNVSSKLVNWGKRSTPQTQWGDKRQPRVSKQTKGLDKANKGIHHRTCSLEEPW